MSRARMFARSHRCSPAPASSQAAAGAGTRQRSPRRVPARRPPPPRPGDPNAATALGTYSASDPVTTLESFKGYDQFPKGGR